MRLEDNYYYVKPVPATNGKTMFVIVHHFTDGSETELPDTYWKETEAQELADDLNIHLYGSED